MCFICQYKYLILKDSNDMVEKYICGRKFKKAGITGYSKANMKALIIAVH